MKQPAAERFADIVSGVDENINLAEAALLIAQQAYPDLDIASCIRRIDYLADECRRRLGAETAHARVIEEMNRYLFEELGFKGDLATFNDPRNSFLNDVLERRKGIPISLSVIYIEIGRRLGLPIHGVSFPGHFLVKVHDGARNLVLDPFSKGKLLDHAELKRRLMHFPDRQRENWDMEQLLVAATHKQILARMLRNLKTLYLEREDYVRALDSVNMILSITPGAVMEIRDRAHIYDQMDHLRAAIGGYEQYLLLSPESGDVDSVRMRLADLKGRFGRLH